MASLAAGNNLCTPTIVPSKKSRSFRHSSLRVRAQNNRDEQGKSRNTFDANLRVLRERIEEAKMKERLERCCLQLSDDEQYQGWNYAPLHVSIKAKRDEQLLQLLQIMGMVVANLGLTILSCTFFLCTIISLLLHLNP